MSVPRLQDVLDTVQAAATNAINAAGWVSPVQVVVGLPVSTELVKILNQKEAIVTVSDRGVSRNSSRYPSNEGRDIPATTCPLSVAILGNVMTFVGSSGPGIDVMITIDEPTEAVAFSPGANDSLATIATNAAMAIDALALGGVEATASGDAVTVVGVPYLYCAASNTDGTLSREVNRTVRSLDLTVWASDPIQRFELSDILKSNIGTEDLRHLYLSDGTPIDVDQVNDGLVDSAQSSYSLYEYHLIVSVEYGTNRLTPATTVLAVKNSSAIDAGAPIAIVSGGP